MRDYVKPELIEEDIKLEDICSESDVTKYGNEKSLLGFFGEEE